VSRRDPDLQALDGLQPNSFAACCPCCHFSLCCCQAAADQHAHKGSSSRLLQQRLLLLLLLVLMDVSSRCSCILQQNSGSDFEGRQPYLCYKSINDSNMHCQLCYDIAHFHK
jgi:hypothetical protein